MTLNTPIRTALIGFGVSGRVFHAPLIAADSQFSLDVIVTGDPDRAAAASEQYPLAQVVATPQEALEWSGDLDLVVIGTPPQTHFDLARDAIERGLNVVVDKPFVTSTANGRSLMRQASQAGVALTVFQNRRWDADFLTLKKLVDEGAFGRVHSFESRFEWWKPHSRSGWKAETSVEQGGGILFDLGTHVIDQAIELFGPVEKHYGEVVRHSLEPSPDADEDTFVSLFHASGVRSRLWMNQLSAQVGPRFHVRGSESAYIKWNLDGQEAALAEGQAPSDTEYGVEAESFWGTLGRDGDRKPVPSERGAYPEFYSLLADSLLRGSPLPVDPAESLEVLKIIEGLHNLS